MYGHAFLCEKQLPYPIEYFLNSFSSSTTPSLWCLNLGQLPGTKFNLTPLLSIFFNKRKRQRGHTLFSSKTLLISYEHMPWRNNVLITHGWVGIFQLFGNSHLRPHTYIHTEFRWPSRRLINSNRKISSAFGLFYKWGFPGKKEMLFVWMDEKLTKISFLEWKSILSPKQTHCRYFLTESPSEFYNVN